MLYLLAKENTFKYELIVMIIVKSNLLEHEYIRSRKTVIHMSRELSLIKLLLLLYYQLINIEMENENEWYAARK